MRSRGRAAVLAAAAGLAAALAGAPAAHAVPDCATPLPATIPVLSGQGSLESVIVDPRGRLFYTDTDAKALMRLDAPGAAPVRVAGGIDAPGGLALEPDGRHLLVGQGDSAAGGALGNLLPSASVLRVDVDTGVTERYATGLRMANGLARATDGTLYASSDVGAALDRVPPGGGAARNDFATVASANGLALSADGRALFAAQTFVPAAIARVDLTDPRKTSTVFRAGGADVTAGLDGMTIDPSGRLVVAANLAGEVWRVTPGGAACALGRGLRTTSAVAYGHGRSGFSDGRLFAVGFDGVVAEIPGGSLVAPPELTDGPAPGALGARVTLLPRTARVVHNRIRVILHVRRGTGYVRPAALRVGRLRLRTGRPVSIPVVPGATLLALRFTLGGVAYARTIGLRR